MLDALFASARFKLTLIYTISIVVFSGSVSFLFYQRTATVIEREYERIEQRLQRELESFPVSPLYLQGRRIQLEDLDRSKSLVAVQLLRINILLSILVAIGSYFLAGQTLKPIQEAMEAQKRFVGDAAHELKTPITALKTSLEVNLMDTRLPKKMQVILQENLEDVVHLENLSSNLLHLAKLEADPEQLVAVPVATIIARLQRRFAPIAKKKTIAFEVTDKTQGVAVKATEASVIELLSIFLDNACKYSPPKSSVTLSVTEQRSGIAFEIRDTGPGIAKKDLPFIFDRFYRADQSRCSEAEVSGYGLGLAVAKKMIQQLGGTIRVLSREGSGSSFIIVLKKTAP